jgi:NAD(P)-dependent dehydrogenase (short-subunit alcohol dehydrogenase family)
MTDLMGALVVVTGGREGVGLALAKEAGRRGATVVIGSISDAAAAVAELTASGTRADWFQVDVSDPAQVDAFAAWVREKHGAANVVINNAAGGDAQGTLLETDADQLRRAFDINVLGYVWIIRAFADDLVRNARAGKASILLNVGSEHALGVPPYVQPISGYTISKQADLAITETARRDLDGTGVQVSLVAPGWVLTEKVVGFMEASEEFRRAVEPYAQTSADVARLTFEGLLEGRHVIVTNPKSVPFARARAEAILADLDRV